MQLATSIVLVLVKNNCFKTFIAFIHTWELLNILCSYFVSYCIVPLVLRMKIGPITVLITITAMFETCPRPLSAGPIYCQQMGDAPSVVNRCSVCCQQMPRLLSTVCCQQMLRLLSTDAPSVVNRCSVCCQQMLRLLSTDAPSVVNRCSFCFRNRSRQGNVSYEACSPSCSPYG